MVRDDVVEPTNLLAKVPWIGNFRHIRQHKKPADSDWKRDDAVDHEKPLGYNQNSLQFQGVALVLLTIASL